MLNYYLIKFVRLFTALFHLFPINNNMILFYSFSGKEYTDSPKYLAEYIDCKKNNFKIIWAVKNPKKFTYLKKKGWKIIPYKSLRHMFYGSVSKFIITNTGPYKAITYRNNQIIINTWHGGGAYKKTGIDNPYKNKYQLLYNKNYAQAGVKLFLSSSDAFSKYAIRGAFGYKGKIAHCGLPRNDILLDKSIRDTIKEMVKKELNIDTKAKFILYAPTWRNYSTEGYEKLNAEMMIDACHTRFSGTWMFIFRGHNLSKGITILGNDKLCKDATSYPDMQKLLIAADILISDYSSCIWDFSLTGKPCFLFTPDLKHYDATFSFYTPIRKWGFDVCETNNKLVDCVKNFSSENYLKNIDKNHKYFGNRETGQAREFVYQYIMECRGGC